MDKIWPVYIYIYTIIWNICAPIYPCMSALDAISLHSAPYWSDYYFLKCI